MTKPLPRHGRRRRWRRVLAWSLAIVVAARLLLALSLPWLLGVAARTAGLDLQCRAAQLSLSGLSLRLLDFAVRDAADPSRPALLSAQELAIDVSTWQLLHGNLVLVDATLAGARLHLQVDADGRLRLPRAWQGDGGTPPAPSPAAPAAAPAGVRLDPPLQVASLRVHDLQVVVEDLATSSRLVGHVDVDVAELGRTDRPGSILVRMHAPDHHDGVWLRATTNTRHGEVRLAWQAQARGLRPALPWLDDPARPGTPHVLAFDLDGDLHATSQAVQALPGLAASLRLRAQLDDQPLLAVDAAVGPSNHEDGAWILPFTVGARGDGLAADLRLARGRLVRRQDATQMSGQLQARAVTLGRLAPWLKSRGVVMPAAGVDLDAALAATIAGEGLTATVDDLQVGAGEPTLQLSHLAVRDLRTRGGRLEVGAVEFEGPRLDAAIGADGAFELFGLRLVGASPANAPVPAAAAAPAAAAPFAWPQVSLGRLQGRGLRLRCLDQCFAEPAPLEVAVDLQGRQLGLGGPAAPGELEASLHLPGAVEACRIRVRTVPSATTLAAEAELQATGLTAASLQPWLARAGLEPRLQAGNLQAKAAVTLRAEAGALGLDARLADLRFTDGDTVLLGLRNLEGRGLVLGQTLDLGTWTIDDPFVAVARTPAGSLETLGLHLAGTAAPGADAPPGAAPAPAAAPTPAAATPPLRHGALDLRGATVRWTDGSQPDAAAVSLGLDLHVDAAAAGAANDFRADVRLEPGLGAVAVQGTLLRGPEGGRLELGCRADGLRGAGLQALLPPSIACTLVDGAFASRCQLEWGTAGPSALSLRASGITLHDADTELLAIDTIDLRLPELGPDRVHVGRAEVRGVRAVAARTTEGLHLPGMRLVATSGAAPPAPAPATTRAATLLPALQVDALEIAIERVVVRERADRDGEPLVAALRLALREPWATAANPAETAPCRLDLELQAPPLLRELRAEATIAPFAIAPTLDLDLRASGIDTSALPRVLPSLADRLEGTCTEATLTTQVHARLDLRRRNPSRFDLSRAFGGEIAIERTELRAEPDGRSLLEWDEASVELRAIDPLTGDVQLREVDVEAPRLWVARGDGGLELLGLRLRPAAAGSDPSPAPTSLPPPVAAGQRPPEFAIDRLQVLGLQFDYVDRTTSPPSALPIQELDLRLQGFSTRAATEARSIAFDASLRGGDVDLPRRAAGGSLLGSVFGAATGLVGLGSEPELEPRPLVEEARVSGTVQPYPLPTGHVRASVHALELTALRGLARQGGVEIGDGLFDLELDARMDGARGTLLRMTPKFTSLSLREPPGGPVSSFLRVPLSLDTVLFLLKNDNDEQVLPLRVQVPADQVRTGRIAEAATEALVKQIADAVAKAAFRVTGALTSSIGLGPGAPAKPVVATLAFRPGDPLPADGSLDEVLAVAAADANVVVVLAHELGAGDVERARELTCPPAAVVAEALARVQAEHAALRQQRLRLAGQLAACYAAARTAGTVQLQAQLAAVDAELGDLEHGEEGLLRQIAGDHERAQRRRARAGAMELAEARLQAVRALVLARLGEAAAPRVIVRSPRGTAVAGLPAGGQVLATTRRRSTP
ncbi:MAG: DUF748 domain-containing protein [Planctomycetes bacterium]|nr:DUF748 domain-containing protein [Planctomycetota bacterium]